MLPSCISIYANPIAILKRQDARRDNIFIWIQMALAWSLFILWSPMVLSCSPPWQRIHRVANAFRRNGCLDYFLRQEVAESFYFLPGPPLKGSFCRGNNVPFVSAFRRTRRRKSRSARRCFRKCTLWTRWNTLFRDFLSYYFAVSSSFVFLSFLFSFSFPFFAVEGNCYVCWIVCGDRWVDQYSTNYLLRVV